jgi:cobalt-zinc-cadmium efflux system outer membrane protein
VRLAIALPQFSRCRCSVTTMKPNHVLIWQQKVVRLATLVLAIVGLPMPGLTRAQAPAPPASDSTNRMDHDPLTLERAIALALNGHPEVRAARSAVNAALGHAEQVRRWPNPELQLAAEDAPVRSGSVLADAKQTLGVTQTIPFPGKKGLERNAAQAGVRVAGAELAQRHRDLIRRVRAAFYEVLAADRAATLARELEQTAAADAEAARRRVEAGAAAEQEQLRAEIAWEQARVELADAERDRLSARLSLAALLGFPGRSEFPVSGALAEEVDPALLLEGNVHRLKEHPALAATRLEQERAELELRRARLEPFPDVTLGVAGGWEGRDRRNGLVEFRVSLPLPIMDRARGREREARARADLAAADAEALELQLRRDWSLARQRLRAAAEQAARYREQILPRADAALRLVQTGFEQGRLGLIDLLDAQRTAAQARRAYLQKLLELNLALADLEALAGSGLTDSSHVRVLQFESEP